MLAVIQDKTSGNIKKFAENAGINAVTLLNYAKGRMPSAEALANICECYSVNINWLLTGTGEKYIAEVDGGRLLDPDPEVASLMEGARRVLTSGNPIAIDALERNIRYFDHAIAVEKRADKMEEMLLKMAEKLAALEKELVEVKRENKRLDEEFEVQSLQKKTA